MLVKPNVRCRCSTANLVEEESAKNRAKDLLLMQREKLASIGQLAAGVAHEINNPMCFIFNNLRMLARYLEQLVQYDHLLLKHCAALPPPAGGLIVAGRKSLDVEYILSDGVNLIAESLDGAERVTKIVRYLKSFSRVDTPEFEPKELCLGQRHRDGDTAGDYRADLRAFFYDQGRWAGDWTGAECLPADHKEPSRRASGGE